MYDNDAARAVVNIAEAIERTVVGLEEGALVEETLWPAIESCGARRESFDRAIEVLLIQRRAIISYDRIYVGATDV